jgi:hypothetical protein
MSFGHLIKVLREKSSSKAMEINKASPIEAEGASKGAASGSLKAA